MNIYAVVASFLVAFVYIVFIRLLDVFEPEKLKYSLLSLFLGMVFLFLLWPLHLIFPFVEEIQEGPTFGERFYFHLTAVAWLEEIVKIIPLLIMLRFKNVINESFDYLKYASIGALGFATVENIQYFDNYGIHIIEGRAFYTAILHMFTSSVIGYLLFVNKSKFKLPPILPFLFGYIVAVIIHSLFNALVSDDLTYYLGAIMIMLLLVIWGRMFNNALNHSEFFHHRGSQKEIFKACTFLVIGWASIFFFAAFAILQIEGASNAWIFIREGLIFGVSSLLAIIFTVGNPKINQGTWRSLFTRKG
jgi:RsiW-degrading membrane proteinase PrsW (M82 family)